jgi:ABC-type transport system involved in cytochrome c biogenesis permease subunit
MEQATRYAPWVVAALAVAYLLSAMRPASGIRDATSNDPRDQMNLRAFGELPIWDHGRYKPIDSWARQHLAQLSGRQDYKDAKGNTQPAVRWMLNLMAVGIADHESTIFDPGEDVRQVLKLPQPRSGAWNAAGLLVLLQKPEVQAKRAALQKLAKPSEAQKNALRFVDLVESRATSADKMEKMMGEKDNPNGQKVFRVDFDQVLHMLNLNRREGLRYSATEIANGEKKVEPGKERMAFITFMQTANSARERARRKQQLDVVAQRSVDLMEQLQIHMGLSRLQHPPLVPDAKFNRNGWMSVAEALDTPGPKARPTVLFVQILRAYALGDAREFNEKVAEYGDLVREGTGKMGRPSAEETPSQLYDIAYTAIYLGLYIAGLALAALSWRFGSKPLLVATGLCFLIAMGLHAVPVLSGLRADAQVSTLVAQEAWFNQLAPFYRCAILYVAALVLAAASWAVWRQLLLRCAFSLFLVTVALHTFALIFRMYLQGRPPVVNLYSSAVFIGWGCALVCAFLEWRVAWNGIPTAVGGLLGFGTMVIAHFLGGSSDTMAVLQAVLDTNFWLATHVTTVTLGYTATYVAGFIALVYLYLVLASIVVAYFRHRDLPKQPAPDYSPAFALVCPVLAVGVAILLQWGAAEMIGLAAVSALAYLLIGSLVVEASRGDDAQFGHNQYVFYLAVLGVAMLPALLIAAVFLSTKYLATEDSPFDDVGVAVAGCLLALGAGYAIYIAMRYAVRNPEEKPGEAAQSVQWMEPLELDLDRSKLMANLVYGVVCFATLLSFVGTVLGGIWADQSWGRFWGWDPKENGAILVVVINALILHARWGGMIKDRGLVMLALVGNMVTMWSWFGTNQLGIGLHSYGFNGALIQMCRWFWLSQLALIGLAALPLRYWKTFSFKPETAPDAPVSPIKADAIKGKGGKPAKGSPQPDVGVQPA